MIPRLELRGIAKSYAGGVAAVRGIDMSLQPGEFLSLLGPSGCGKSTTLSMIAGFEAPSEGSIFVDGMAVQGMPPGRRRIGMVFQDYAVFGRLTVLDNLRFGLEAQGVPPAERRKRISEIAEKLELETMLSRRGGGLNMSEMQRVALARVLVTEPRLLLLDEPMSNLDAALRMSLRGELKAIQRSLGQTVLYVTHDQVEAMSMSDRIAVMRDGLVEQIGTPDEIYHHPTTRFVAEFIGDPPINLIPCTVKRSGHDLVAVTALHDELILRPGEAPHGEQILGVRPHDLHLSKSANAGGVVTTARFIETLGVEDVVHLDYGDGLAAAIAPPGFAGVGERLWVSIDAQRAHIIRRDNDRVAQVDGAR